jgi:hypothetical protein
LSETLSRDRKNVFRPVTGRSKKKTRTSRSRSRRLKPAVRFLETVRQAAGIKNTLRSFETPSPEYQIHRRDIVTLAVGSNDDAAERFDMGRVRHLGGGGRARGATAAGRVTHLQNTEPGMPAFQRLMSVYSAEAMVASGVFPGRDPMNPMRTAVLYIVVQETRRQRVERREGKRTVDGGAGAARAARRARIPRRRRAVARDLAETSRASAAARRDRRARRARSPAARRVADTCVTSEGTDLTRVRQKARGGDARGRLARARARRGAGSGAWRGRATSHRGFRGERISLWSRTYLVTSPVLMSRRSCLSTRTAAFLNTPPVAAVREERGIKGERERSANARDVRDVASTFDRARRGIVPRLAPERVAPSPTGHAMPRAA